MKEVFEEKKALENDGKNVTTKINQYSFIGKLNSNNQLKSINVTELKDNKCDFYLNFDESDGFYTIISLSDPEYCIGVNILNDEEGTEIKQIPLSSGPHCKWKIYEENNIYSFELKLNGLFLDVRNASDQDNTPLILYRKKGSIGQKFKL